MIQKLGVLTQNGSMLVLETNFTYRLEMIYEKFEYCLSPTMADFLSCNVIRDSLQPENFLHFFCDPLFGSDFEAGSIFPQFNQ